MSLDQTVDETKLFNELIYQIKMFFIARNLDGKSLFRVIGKQGQQ